jgi:hypothetical protein
LHEREAIALAHDVEHQHQHATAETAAFHTDTAPPRTSAAVVLAVAAKFGGEASRPTAQSGAD